MPWLEKRVAKRKLKCRWCGAEIRKGGEYWVYHYMSGPYLRRNAICRKCAEKEARYIVKSFMSVAFFSRMCEEKSETDNMKVFDAVAYELLYPVRKWYECRKDPDELASYAYRHFKGAMRELVDFRKLAEEFLENVEKEEKVKWVVG